MEKMEWENILIEWVNCLKISDRIEQITDLRNGDFFASLQKVITKSTETSQDTLTFFFDLLDKHYTNFSIKNKSSVHLLDLPLTDLKAILSLLLHYTCIYDRRDVLTSPMCHSISQTNQTIVRDFLEQVTSSVTVEDLDKAVRKCIDDNKRNRSKLLLSNSPTVYSSPLTEFLNTPPLMRNGRLHEKDKLIAQLRSLIEVERDEKNDLQAELNVQVTKNKRIEKVLELKTSEVLKLKSELLSLENRTPTHHCDSSAEDKRRLRSEIQSLEKYVEQIGNEQEEIRKEKASLVEKVDKLKSECSIWEEKYLCAERSVEALNDLTRDQQSEIRSLKLHCSELSTMLEEMRMRSFNGSLTDDSFQISRLADYTPQNLASTVVDVELQEAKKEIEDVSKRLRIRDEEIKSLQSDNQNLLVKLNEVKDLLNQTNNELVSCNNVRAEFGLRIISQNEEIETLKTVLEETEHNLLNSQRDFQDLKRLFEKNVTKLHELKLSNENLSRRNESLKECCFQAERFMKSSEDLTKNITKQLESNQDDIQGIKTGFESCRSVFKKKLAELISKHNNLEESFRESEKKVADLENLKIIMEKESEEQKFTYEQLLCDKRAELLNLETNLNNLTALNRDLLNKVSENEREIGELRQNLVRSQEEITETSCRLSVSEKDRENLGEVLKEARHNISDLEIQIASLKRDHVNQMNETVKYWKKQVQDIETKLWQKQNELEDCNSKLGKCQNELATTQTELTKSEKSLHNCQTEFQMCLVELKKHQEELDKSRELVKQTRDEFDNSQDKLKTILLELEKTQREYKNSLVEHEKCQSELEKCQNLLESSQRELMNRQGELERSRELVKQAQDELDDCRHNLKQCQIELENSQDEFKKTFTELETTRQEYKNRIIEHETCQNELEDCQKELEKCQGELVKYQEELNKSRELVKLTQDKFDNSQDNLKHCQIELENSQDEFKKTFAELETTREEYKNRIIEHEKCQNELENCQKELESYQGELVKSQEELDRSRELVKLTRDEFNKSQDNLKQCQIELENSQDEFKKTFAELETTREEYKNRIIKHETCQNELEGCQKELEKCQGELVKYQEELNKSRELVKLTQDKFDNSQDNLKQCQIELENSQDEFKKTFAELETTREEYKNRIIEHEKCQNELENCQKELDSYRGELVKSQEELDKSRELVKLTRDEFNKSQDNLKQCQIELENSQDEFKKTFAELEMTREEHKNIIIEHETCQNELEDCQKELEKCQGELVKYQEELNKSRQLVKLTRDEFDKSQDNLKQCQIKIENDHENFQKTLTELEQIHEKHKNSIIENAQCQKELESCREELKKCQEALDKSKQLVEQTQAELDNSQDRLQNVLMEFEKTREEYNNSLVEHANCQNHLESCQRELLSCKEELEGSRKLVKQTQDEFDKCRDELKHSQTELENCQDNFKKMLIELENTKEEYKNNITEHAKCQKDLQDCQSKLEIYQNELKSCQEELVTCREELVHSREKVEKTQNETEKYQNDLEKIQKELETCQKYHQECLDKLDKSQSELENCRGELQKCRDDLKDSQEELKKSQADQQKALDEYSLAINNVHRLNSDLLEEKEKVLNEFSLVDSKKKYLEDTVAQLNEKISSLNSARDDWILSTDRLVKENENFSLRCQKFEEKCKGLQDIIEVLKGERFIYEKDNSELKQKVDILENEKSRLKEHYGSIENELVELRIVSKLTIDQLTDAAEKSNKDLTELRGAYEKLIDEKNISENNVRRVEAEKCELKHQIEELKEENESNKETLKKTLEVSDDEKSKLEKELISLRDKIELLEQSKIDLNSKLERCDSDFNQLEQKLYEKEEENREINLKMETLQLVEEQLEEMKQKISDYENLKEEREKLGIECDKQRNKVLELEKKHKEVTADLNLVVKGLETEITRKELEIKSLEDSLKMLKSNETMMREQSIKLELILNSVKEEHARELERIQSRYDKLLNEHKSTFANLQLLNEKISNELATSKRENRILQDELASKNDEKLVLEQTVKEVDFKCDKLKNDLAVSTREVDDNRTLRNEREQLLAKIEQLTNDLSKSARTRSEILESQAKIIKETENNILRAHENAVEVKNDLIRQLRAAEGKIENESRNYCEVVVKMEQLQGEYEKIRGRLELLQNIIRDLFIGHVYSSSGVVTDALFESEATLNEALQLYKNSIEIMKKQNSHLQTSLDEMRSENQLLIQQKTAETLALESLQTDYDLLVSKYNQLMDSKQSRGNTEDCSVFKTASFAYRDKLERIFSQRNTLDLLLSGMRMTMISVQQNAGQILIPPVTYKQILEKKESLEIIVEDVFKHANRMSKMTNELVFKVIKHYEKYVEGLLRSESDDDLRFESFEETLMSELMEKITDLNDRTSDAYEQLKNLNKEIENIWLKQAKMNQQPAKPTANVDKFKEEEWKKKNMMLKQKLTLSENAKSNMERKVKLLQEENKKLSKDVSYNGDILYKTLLQEHIQFKEDHERILNDYKNQYDRLLADYEALKLETDLLKRSQADSLIDNQQFGGLQESYDKTVTANSKLENEIISLRNIIEQQNARLIERDAELQSKEAYEKVLEDYNKVTTELDTVKYKRLRDREDFQMHLKKVKDEYEKREMKKIQVIRSEYETKLEKMKDKMLKLYKDEISKEMDRVKTEVDNSSSYAKTIENLRSDLFEAEQKLSFLEIERDMLRSQLNKMRTEPNSLALSRESLQSLEFRLPEITRSVSDRDSIRSFSQLGQRQRESMIQLQRETSERSSIVCKRESAASDDLRRFTLPKNPEMKILEEITVSRMTSMTGLPNGIGNMPMEEEEEECFNNKYLTDMKEGRCVAANVKDSSRYSELAWRNSLLPPHLKSSYPAETQFVSPARFKDEDIKLGAIELDNSHCKLLPGEKPKKKDFGTTSYKKPGPPTPSKNGGRSSLQGNESYPLREHNNDSKTPKRSTPNRIKALFMGKSALKENSEGVSSPRKKSVFFRRPR